MLTRELDGAVATHVNDTYKGHSRHRRIVIHDRCYLLQTAPIEDQITVGMVCDSVHTTDDSKHKKRPRSSLNQQQNQCQIVEEEIHSHIPMSFTGRLHCSKRGPALELQNVIVSHETTIIDKKPSVYRKQLCTNFGEIRDLFTFHLGKLISRRQGGKPQELENVFLGTFTARLTVKTRTLQNTTMTRDERNLCYMLRKGPFFFFGGIRAAVLGAPKIGLSSFKSGRRSSHARSSHFKESHGIPHDIQCFAANLYTESKRNSAAREATSPKERWLLAETRGRCIKTRNVDVRRKIRLSARPQTPREGLILIPSVSTRQGTGQSKWRLH